MQEQRTEIVDAPELPEEGSRGGEWTVVQASAIEVARERTGCPLETLACWSPERKAEVLIGNLDTLFQWPKYVSFTALCC